MISGDQAATQQFIANKRPRLWALAKRVTGSQSDAEDVAQETLVRTWSKLGEWDLGRAKIDTWMHRVALNLCIDRLRRRKNTVDIEEVTLVDQKDNAFDLLAEDQRKQRVKAALNDLPDRQRHAIILNYYQGLSNIEAAKVMEISVDALESLLSRARRHLRETLKSEATG
jgi:RNA polymerase sigma-70 factor (ECF subfamily)